MKTYHLNKGIYFGLLSSIPMKQDLCTLETPINLKDT